MHTWNEQASVTSCAAPAPPPPSAVAAPLVAWATYMPAFEDPSYKAPESFVLYFTSYRKQYIEVWRRT
jgi:hypothetical protein